MKLKMGVLSTMIAVAMVVAPLNVNAAVTGRFVESNCFSEEWENTAVFVYSSNSKEFGKVVYGFDEFMIDEDYCWTKSDECNYQSIVTNAKGAYSSSVKSKGGSWAKEEITHKGTYVKYGMWLKGTYVNISTYTEKSDEK